MSAKQRHSVEKFYPNGLQDALEKAREIDPDLGATELARRTNLNKQTVDRYIKGQRKLTVPVAEKLAPHVRATAAELLQVETTGPSFERVPLLSWVSAGRLQQPDGVRLKDVKEHLVTAGLSPGRWIALRVQGNSMDRIAPDGSVIFVDLADTRPRDSHFYVFADDSGEATFKRFKSGRPPKLQPFSTSVDFETVPAPEGLRVIGRVRRILTDLR